LRGAGLSSGLIWVVAGIVGAGVLLATREI
jgi:hypothetical protein